MFNIKNVMFGEAFYINQTRTRKYSLGLVRKGQECHKDLTRGAFETPVPVEKGNAEILLFELISGVAEGIMGWWCTENLGASCRKVPLRLARGTLPNIRK